MRFPKKLVIASVVGAGLVAAGWYALLQIQGSFVYGVRAEFESTPDNDQPLEEWLRQQPGVFHASVSRDGNGVVAIWAMIQTVGRDPPPPDIRAAFGQFGYRGMTSFDPDWTSDKSKPSPKKHL